MKVVINYDFFNAIKDAKEPLHPLKLIRNRKKKYILLFPLGVSIAVFSKFANEIDYDFRFWAIYFFYIYGYSIGIELLSEFIARKISHKDRDIYATKAIHELKKLVLLLKELNINTDLELLLESELYQKNYELLTEEKKLPSISTKKYIVVPSRDKDGEIIETSILQEHVVSSKEYILSIGKPQKNYKKILIKTPS